MSPLEHLGRLTADGQQGQILSVVFKIEAWLRGNAIMTPDNESGVIEIKAGQINDATLEIRRVIYQGVHTPFLFPLLLSFFSLLCPIENLRMLSRA